MQASLYRLLIKYCAYSLAIATLYLYVCESLIEIGFESLPTYWLPDAMIWVMLFGGMVSGVILYILGGRLNRIFGVVMIVLNFTVVPYLFMKAMV